LKALPEKKTFIQTTEGTPLFRASSVPDIIPIPSLPPPLYSTMGYWDREGNRSNRSNRSKPFKNMVNRSKILKAFRNRSKGRKT